MSFCPFVFYRPFVLILDSDDGTKQGGFDRFDEKLMPDRAKKIQKYLATWKRVAQMNMA